jgi:hypothetical protein
MFIASNTASSLRRADEIFSSVRGSGRPTLNVISLYVIPISPLERMAVRYAHGTEYLVRPARLIFSVVAAINIPPLSR